jgi:hypothetical protein
MGSGVYALAGRLVIPSGVSLMGVGNGKLADVTTFKCTAAGAGITFGALGVSSVGGISGGFVIDGNAVAINPMIVGRVVGATFDAIDIVNGATGGASLLVQEAQNNAFIGMNIDDGDGDGVVLDRGCGGNLFVRVESTGHGRYNLVFTASAVTAAPLYARPTHNTFMHCIFERRQATTLGMVLHEAGHMNALISCVVADNDAIAASTLITCPILGGNVSADFRIDGCYLDGNSLYTTAIDVAAGASVRVLGGTLFVGLLNGFSVAVGAVVDAPSMNMTSVTNYAVGAGAQDTAIRNRVLVPLESKRRATTDQYFVGLIEGESGQRVKLTPTLLSFGDGTGFTHDVIMARNAANVLDLFAGLRLRNTNGTGYLRMDEQTSDPSAVANAGMLFTKDNGSGKTQLCVRFGTGAVAVLATEL